MTNLSHVKIRTVKSWQGKEPFYVFQSNFSGLKTKDLNIKKFYFVVDIRQSQFGLSFELEKPSQLALTGGMVNALRKYCRGATISDIQKDDKNGDIWMTLFSQGKIYWLKLARSRPPELSLIDSENTVLMRWGAKGTFTKKHRAEPAYEELQENLIPLKESLIEDFLSSVAKTMEDEEVHDSHDDEPMQGDDLFPKAQRQLQQKLNRKLKMFKKSLEKQQGKLPTEEAIKELEAHAHLLQSFAYLVKPGDFELALEAELSGRHDDTVIPLDPDKNIGSNIESYFVKSKKLRKSRDMGLRVISDNKRDIAQLSEDIEKIKELCTDSEIEYLQKKYHITAPIASQGHQAKPVAKPYKEFQTMGHSILVGKGPRENDELTKSAKANDYWLHTAGSAGSHVIIPASKPIKEALPEELLRAGAILAVHYSKYKSDLAGEVYVARKSEIKKQKGMPPGLWNVERCKTIFIRYQEDELKLILDQMIR